MKIQWLEFDNFYLLTTQKTATITTKSSLPKILLFVIPTAINFNIYIWYVYIYGMYIYIYIWYLDSPCTNGEEKPHYSNVLHMFTKAVPAINNRG